MGTQLKRIQKWVWILGYGLLKEILTKNKLEVKIAILEAPIFLL